MILIDEIDLSSVGCDVCLHTGEIRVNRRRANVLKYGRASSRFNRRRHCFESDVSVLDCTKMVSQVRLRSKVVYTRIYSEREKNTTKLLQIFAKNMFISIVYKFLFYRINQWAL